MPHADYAAPAPSKAAIAGHPIHPMLIPFPVTCLTLVAVTDIVYAAGGGVFWATASYWLLIAGLISGALAAIAGLVDFLGVRRARRLRQAWAHAGLNVVVMAIALVNLLLRVDNLAEAVVPEGVILSVIGTLGLIVSGWLGGELSYRHRIGVAEAPEYEGERVDGREPRAAREVHLH